MWVLRVMRVIRVMRVSEGYEGFEGYKDDCRYSSYRVFRVPSEAD